MSKSCRYLFIMPNVQSFVSHSPAPSCVEHAQAARQDVKDLQGARARQDKAHKSLTQQAEQAKHASLQARQQADAAELRSRELSKEAQRSAQDRSGHSITHVRVAPMPQQKLPGVYQNGPPPPNAEVAGLLLVTWSPARALQACPHHAARPSGQCQWQCLHLLQCWLG